MKAHIINISKTKRIEPSSSVRIGSLWMPVSGLPQALARFTKLVFCLTGLNAHPYSLRGSATALKFQGQYLLFCCFHQISDCSPGNVVVPIDRGGRKLVSGTSFIRLNDLPELVGEELTDVCAIYFNPPDYGEPSLERGFFDIQGADVWRGEPDTTFLVYGYPTALRELGIDSASGELNDIKVKMTASAAYYHHASAASGVHAITLQGAGERSSDGLSGGAVFHLGEDARGFFCGFAGIILRGGAASDVIHFMDARLVQDFFRYNADRLKK